MPFKSEKQRKYMWAKLPALAKKWTKKYGSKISSKISSKIGGKNVAKKVGKTRRRKTRG